MSSKSVRPPPELGKNANLVRSYIARSEERKSKVDLYGPAGVPILEEVWLMGNADAHCTLGREEAQTTQRTFCSNFFVLL